MSHESSSSESESSDSVVFSPRAPVDQSTLLQNRYLIKRSLGKGAFGKVFEAWDKHSKETVAIKISKSSLQRNAKREVQALKELQALENGFVVKILDHFEWQGRICIVMEYLSKNLYQVLRETGHKGLSLACVKMFGWQLLMALSLLEVPGLIHCDLKPENIMLKSPDMAGIKLIDFGSSSKATERLCRYVQSRYYRAPEVLLELPYGSAVDIWSVGCILAELHTGRPLFYGTDSSDQLAKIVELKGTPPHNMIKKSLRGFQIFDLRNFQLLTVNNPKHNSVAELIEKNSSWAEDPFEFKSFLDLLEKMLVYDPKDRLTPQEALRHPFFSDLNSSLEGKVLTSYKNTEENLHETKEDYSPYSKLSTAMDSSHFQPPRQNSCISYQNSLQKKTYFNRPSSQETNVHSM